jgi:mono/diheme cytochrome c family protein
VRLAPIACLACAAGLAAGCGTSQAKIDRTLYEQRCASCHAIAPSAVSPVAAARNLYDAHPSQAEIRRAITLGAHGMPANLVKGDKLDNVVAYVLSATARS